jgi:hypothetical protein
MKFSWPLFSTTSIILFVAKFVIVPAFGFMIFNEAMGAGWGGASSSPFWAIPVVLILFILCPGLILCAFLFRSSELLIPSIILGEIFGTFLYAAVFTRIYLYFCPRQKADKTTDETSLPSDAY